MTAKYRSDYNYGIDNEETVYKIICDLFTDDNIQHKKGRYCKHDFIGNNYSYELKTRRLVSTKYDTTIIPVDKINKTEDAKKQRFLFCFDDGLFYIDYDEEVFNNFEKKMFRRYDRGSIDKDKEYYYIPIKLLNKI